MRSQLKIIGLTESDIDRDTGFKSIDELIRYVSSSNRLFHKTIKHLILRDIQRYFDNHSIIHDDKLQEFFPRRRRRSEWLKFANYLELKVPGLKLTRLSIIILMVLAISIATIILWIIVGQMKLLAHSMLAGVPLMPIILMAAIIPFGLVALLGRTDLPVKTVGELADEIISRNLSDLLTEDKRKYRDMITKELMAD